MKYRPCLLLAELTYHCPLHCPYCSNPVTYPGGQELSTAQWRRVLEEASQLGVLHVGFSGGEPLRRADLAELVAAARAAGLYTNLITSAVGLQRRRAAQLRQAGLDSIQISFQSDQPSLADKIAGTSAHALKLQAAKVVRELGFPLTVNVVLHRGNIHRLEQIISLAQDLEAERLELANAQYYRLGLCQSRRLVANPPPDRAGRRDCRRAQKTPAGPNGYFIRYARLLQRAPETLHEWLGLALLDRQSRWRCPAMPDRFGHQGPPFRQCSDPAARLDLEPLRVVQPFSRHRMDAGALWPMPVARN